MKTPISAFSPLARSGYPLMAAPQVPHSPSFHTLIPASQPPRLFLGLALALCAFLPAALRAEAPPAAPNPTPALLAPPTEQGKLEQAVFQRATQYGDATTAIAAASRLIELDPAQAQKWKEKLASLYFNVKRHAPALAVCDDLITTHGGEERVGVLELRALCLESLGRAEPALEQWKKIHEKSQSAAHAVRVASVLMEQKKLAEAEATVRSALEKPIPEGTTVSVPKTREEIQSIPAAAALENLLGAVLSRKQPADVPAALAAYDRALDLAPEFEIARRNQAALRGGQATEVPKPAQAPAVSPAR